MIRNVLITCAAQNAALACCRALHAAGWRVTAVDDDPRAKALGSRCVTVSHVAPTAPGDDPDAYADFILELLRKHRFDVLIPTTDAAIFALLPRREEIEAHCAVPWPSTDALHAAANKDDTFATARRLGLATPAMVRIGTPDEVIDHDALPYPVVVKPHRSLVDGRKIAVTYAGDAEELAAVLADLPDGAYPLLLQQRIVGPGEGYFGVWRHGEPVVESAHRRLREMPPSGGVSTLRESIPIARDMRDAARRLLAEWRWHGPAMVEFKRGGDGRPYLMEVNGRLWGSLQLAVDAGIDVPLAAALVAVGEPVPEMTYHAGIKTRWLLGDLDATLTRLFKREGDLKMPPGSAGRLRWLLSFCVDFFRPTVRLEVCRRHDIGPFSREFRKWLANKWALVKKRVRTGSQKTPALLHVHSTFSYDGELSVAEIAALLRERGIRVGFLTEHTRQLSADDVRRLREECAAHSDDELLLVPGLEFDQKGDHHVLALGVTELLPEDDYEKLVDLIHDAGGLAVLAHPEPGDITGNLEFAGRFDAVEVWNTMHDGQYVPNADVLWQYRAARRAGAGFVAVAGADFHFRDNLKDIAMVFDPLRELSWPAVREALLAGRFHIESRRVLLSSHGAGPLSIALFRLAHVCQQRVAVIRAWYRSRKTVPYWEFLGHGIEKAGPAAHEPFGRTICWRVMGTFSGNDRRGECCRPFPTCRDCDYYRHVNNTWPHERPLRVLHLIETSNPGGAELMMLDLVSRMNTERVRSHVLLIKHGWLEKQFQERGVPVTVRPIKRRRDWRWMRDVARLIKRRRYDLLHSHEFTMNVYTFWTARSAGVPHLPTVHGNLEYLRARVRRRWMYRLLARGSCPLVAVSGEIKRVLVQELKLPASCVQVVHNGVTLEESEKEVDFRRERGLPPGAKLIGVIGRLHPIKGPDVMVEAMSHIVESVPEAHVIFFGHGHMRPMLERRVERDGLTHAVTFAGYTEGIGRRLDALDLIAVPSRYEGLSLALIEAMAASRPIVATNVGGNAEAIVDGESGCLVPSEQPEALAAACVRLLNDPALAGKFGTAARRRVERDFSIDKMLETYLALYESKAGGKK
ncbi:MAG: glycosyltransferase [Candidatus Lernaella stagnicola]|nr:glycosyltransferase [Candidatus Lernaella stagnicola]